MQDLHSQNRLEKKQANLNVAKHRLVIFEDDKNFAETLALEFSERGYDVFKAASLSELSSLSFGLLSFAIVDLRVGQENGLLALEALKKSHPECRVVVLTGYGSIATAVQAMKLGASNYLTKPVAIEQLEKALWMDLSEGDASSVEESRTSLARHEREYIEYVLSQCGGNITKAAAWLGVHRQSLQRKLKKYPPRQ